MRSSFSAEAASEGGGLEAALLWVWSRCLHVPDVQDPGPGSEGDPGLSEGRAVAAVFRWEARRRLAVQHHGQRHRHIHYSFYIYFEIVVNEFNHWCFGPMTGSAVFWGETCLYDSENGGMQALATFQLISRMCWTKWSFFSQTDGTGVVPDP